MTPDAKRDLLDMLSNGAPDCALRELVIRAEAAGLSATPPDIDTRGLSPGRARRTLRTMLKRLREQLRRDVAALFD